AHAHREVGVAVAVDVPDRAQPQAEPEVPGGGVEGLRAHRGEPRGSAPAHEHLPRGAALRGGRVGEVAEAVEQGPCLVEEDSFVGAQALIFRSRVGCGSVVEPRARLVGVTVPPERYVPAGSCISNQAEADRLPRIDERYPFRAQNAEAVRVNTELVRAYLGQRQGRI
nr:hypothetical protein [bacterium]